jgi:hypothetical protein
MIKQRTPEWLEAKKTTIGGSEIGALVANLCTAEEIQKAGITLDNESFFTSSMSIGIKWLYGLTTEIPAVNSLYGNAMEKPSIAFLNENFQGVLSAVGTDDFVVSGKNKHISCSPDGYIDLVGTVEEFGTGKQITSEDGRGLLELKTVRLQKAMSGEPSMQYLIQGVWNADVCNMDWFCLFTVFVKDYNNDNDFTRGMLCEMAKSNKIAEMKEFVDYEVFFYKQKNGIINLCRLALKRFLEKIKEAKNLEFHNRWTVFDFSKSDKLFKQEKSLIAQIDNEELRAKYGSRLATDEEEELFVKRYKLHSQIAKLTEEKNETEGKVMKALCDNKEIIAFAGERHNMNVKSTTKGVRFKNINPTIEEFIK